MINNNAFKGNLAAISEQLPNIQQFEYLNLDGSSGVLATTEDDDDDD